MSLTARPHAIRFNLVAAAAVLLAAFASLWLLHAWSMSPAGAAFDLRVQAAIHAATTPAWLMAARVLTFLGEPWLFGPVVALACLAAWLYGARSGRSRLRLAGTLLAVSLAGAALVDNAAKHWFHRPRPHPAWAVGIAHGFAFPSGHALFATVLYGTLVLLLAFVARARAACMLPAIGCAMLLAGGIGLSRVALGAHLPTDVLAGWLGGAVWLCGMAVIIRRASYTSATQPATPRL